jgi:hypothetical protein
VIIAGLIFYRNGPEQLDRLLRSLEANGVDRLVAADGPFRGVSKDVKTVREEWEVLRSFKGNKLLLSPQVYESEAIKRTIVNRMAYHHMAKGGGHHLLGIDADEELLTPIPIPEWGKLGVAKLHLPEREDLDKFGERAVLHIRLHQLSAGLTWGPSHFEMTSHGIRYSMPHCILGSTDYTFEIMHHPHEKSEEYIRYNERIRPSVEMGVEPEREIPTWPHTKRAETLYVGLPAIEEIDKRRSGG